MVTPLFEPGDWIENRYRVQERLGSGGMGTVYRVEDAAQADGAAVLALKTLAVAGAEPAMVEDFQREFRVLTQLRHPNLVNVYDYGVTRSGTLYFTMDYLEGQDLRTAVGRMGCHAATPLMVQVCRALAYIHARRVLHRDLKPANVLVAGSQVKLVDFGIASDLRRSALATPTGGTPGYVAPEVQAGGPVDGRADLYSLGAVWYELLVGHVPLGQAGMGHDRGVRLALVEALAAQPELPESLVEVVARLLAWAPEDRYASANAVISAINALLGGDYALETRETAASYALQAPFVGREAELAALTAAWSAAQAGEGGIVLVGGPAGVGKTRLMEELAIPVELGGAWLVWGACAVEGSGAYRPWREVLRVLIRYVEQIDADLVREVGPVLASLLPELWERPYLLGTSAPAPLEPQLAQVRLNRAIARVLRAAAGERPTLIVIEDAHRAGEATLALLAFLARGLGAPGLLLGVTYRDDEVGPAHPLAALDGDAVRRVAVRSLPAESTTALAGAMLGVPALPSALVERLQRTTGGNAFFVQELVRSLAEEGAVLQRTASGWRVDAAALATAALPGSIQQVLARRIARLAPLEREVLARAAVVGAAFWPGAVARLGPEPLEDVQRALDGLLDKGFLLVEEGPEGAAFAGEVTYGFQHATLREVVYDGVPASRRRTYHGRVATWLASRGEAQRAEHAGTLAEHLERAGRPAEALPYLRRAGEYAAARFANAEALAYLARALALTPPDDAEARYALFLTRERVHDLQGDREAQAQDGAALADLAEALDDDARRATVARRRAHYAEAIGDYPAAVDAARRAVTLARALGAPDREAEGLLAWGRACLRQGDFDAAQTRYAHALALARAADARQLTAQSLCGLGKVLIQQGQYAEAEQHMARALPIFRETGDRQGEAQALMGLGVVHWYRQDFTEAEACQRQALVIRREMGDRRGEAAILVNLGGISHMRGDYAQAERHFAPALARFREIGDRYGEGTTAMNLGEVYMTQGDDAQADVYLRSALDVYRETGNRAGEGVALVNLSLARQHLGDVDAAQAHVRQALSIAREIGDRHIEAAALMGLGSVLAACGCWGEAAEAYEAALTIRRAMQQPNLAAEVQAGLARVALAQGDLARAQGLVEAILNHLDHGTLDGANEPFAVYLTCYRVLQAAGDPRADEILHTAYTLLQTRAANITDTAMRRSYLENVPAHRAIVRAWYPGG